MILCQIIDISKEIFNVKYMIPFEKLQLASLDYGMMMNNREMFYKIIELIQDKKNYWNKNAFLVFLLSNV